MRIYTFITAVLIPILLMVGFNSAIFKHVRSSTRRVQVQTINNDNLHRPRISSREIALLKHMMFMFVTFVIGWTPVYAIVIVDQYVFTYINQLTFQYSVILGESAILAITIHLFISNHEIRDYCINKVHGCLAGRMN